MRVFISSTFRDMQAERDELVKRVFPQLRKLCEKRGVLWGEVDLRWGITDEKQGEALPICLAEIRNCRPYFIGMIGERYGWVPGEIPEELLNTETWLRDHTGQSITDLEFLHGVLNDPAMAEHAFFYFRDPAYIQSLPPEERTGYLEAPTAAEVAQFGEAMALQRAEDRQRKLAVLKALVRQSGLPLHEAYRDPRQLGELVLYDLTAVIERLFPPGSLPDPVEVEAEAHDAFARRRTEVYIPRQADFQVLDGWADGNSPPLVILGEAGIGKSALLANWAARYRQAHPEQFVLTHFIGASPSSADWVFLVRRVMTEFNRRFGLELTFPLQPEALRPAFANSLHLAAQKGKVILVLDGLDQLAEGQGARELLWLPEKLPPGVSLLLSTQEGPPQDEIQRRGWPTHQVAPLTGDEREQLIHDYLALYSKSLSPARSARLGGVPLCGNPLFLRAVLEELRQFGLHEQLDAQIDRYLGVTNIPELFSRILERYEADYERDRPGLVAEACTLLWAARRGLSEDELLEMLGSEGNRLPHALWSPFFLALEPALTIRSGLINFSHAYLRQAVAGRYLTAPHQPVLHQRLADYFDRRELSPRQVDELPWQLAQAEDWERLSLVLADPEFLASAWDRTEFEVQAYWAQVENASPYRMTSAYRHILQNPEHYLPYLRQIAFLLHTAGHPQEALILQECLVTEYQVQGDLAMTALTLGNTAMIHAGFGDVARAAAFFDKEVEIYQELGDERSLARARFNQANLLHGVGEVEAATAIYLEAEAYWRRTNDLHSLALSLGNRGTILRETGQMGAALALFKEKEHLCWQLGDRREMARAIGSQSTVLLTWGNLPEAERLLQQEDAILRDLGDLASLPTCLGNQGIVKQGMGQAQAAMEFYREQEQVCLQIADQRGRAESLGRQGTLLLELGELDTALVHFREQERLARQMGLQNELQVSLGNQAMILRRRGDSTQALVLQEEKADLCRGLGNRQSLAIALGNIGNIYAERGSLERAMQLYKEKEVIDRELGNVSGLAHCLGNQAGLLVDLGRPAEALRLLKEQEQLCRTLNNPGKVAHVLLVQAKLLVQSFKSPTQALPLVQESCQLALVSGDQALIRQAQSILTALNSALGRG